MIKSLTAFTILALLGSAVVALPWFAPQAEARESLVLAKADRLEISSFPDCVKQIWPNLTSACLRNSGSGGSVVVAGLTTARR